MTAPDEKRSGPSAEAKEKFRQALEAKKARSSPPTADGTGSGGTVRGSETAGPGKRQFRRKAGSA